MRLFVCSLEDQASVNIRESLVRQVEWRGEGEFDGNPVLRHGDSIMVTIHGIHLQADNIDCQVEGSVGIKVSEVVFLSRHRAASGKPSLTVHPIGNFGKAEYGGRDECLVRASPDLMTGLLRRLHSNAVGQGFEVTFEVTHHGPYLTTPTLFIEIGSSEAMWGHKGAADAIAASLLDVQVRECPKTIGVGGGHYAPRFSEVCLTKKISFGHMLPNHALDLKDETMVSKRIAMALGGSEAKLAYIHKKSMERSEATAVKKIVKDLGAEVVDSSDLEDL